MTVHYVTIAAGFVLALAIRHHRTFPRRDGGWLLSAPVISNIEPEHAGATEAWSPKLDAARAEATADVDAARRELDVARRELEPLIEAMDDALREALHTFRLAVRESMRTAQRWHAWDTADNAYHCEHPDCDGRAGIARWRLDTPTSGYPIVKVGT